MNQPRTRLEILDLRKSFEGHHVLKGASLAVREGEVTVLMGASGSGKSVLAKCVLGLMPVDGGRILLDGKDMAHMRASEREILMKDFGVLFQRGALFDSLSIWQNVAFGLIEGRGVAPDEAKARAVDTLARLGLDAATAELAPSELSGGMQKRVALARAIVAQPKFLVLDEPVEGLDPIMSAIVSDLVLKTVRDMGATTLAITNNIACARRIATRIFLLKDGAIIWKGGPSEIDSAADPYVREFLRNRMHAAVA